MGYVDLPKSQLEEVLREAAPAAAKGELVWIPGDVVMAMVMELRRRRNEASRA